MSDQSDSELKLGRVAVAATAATLGALVWSQALAAFLASRLNGGPQLAVPVALAVVATTLATAMTWRRSYSALYSLVLALLAGGSLSLLVTHAWAAVVSLLLVVPLASVLGRRFAASLPTEVDAMPGRRPWVALAWGALALITVVQVARLSSFMVNHELDWFLSTTNPFWAKHDCLPAYFQGAELAAHADPNIYSAAHYPALNPEATPTTQLLGMTAEDPFQYAPQFLLWPYLGMQLTHDYSTLKIGWFAVQMTLFMVFSLCLARWVGGRSGGLAAWIAPLALISFPALHNFQYGQFHLMAVGLAIAAMVAFNAKRTRLGGALLAVSVLSKLFPGVLLVVLAAQRRFRELGYTLVFGTLLTAVTLGLFGTEPFEAFFSYHLARLQSGAAFAFGDAWPEVRQLLIADNQGFFGLVLKLEELGVPGMNKTAASWLNRGAALSLFGLAVWTGLRPMAQAREPQLLSWMGLLVLASMLSTGAFGDYVPATVTWLFTFVAYRMNEQRELIRWLVPAWALQFFLAGTSPIGDWFEPTVMTALSAVGVAGMAGLAGWAVMSPWPRTSFIEPVPSLPVPVREHSPAPASSEREPASAC